MRVLERFNQLKSESDEEGNLIGIYHEFMRAYGYIPLEDWKKLPIPLVIELRDKLEEEARKMKSSMRKR